MSRRRTIASAFLILMPVFAAPSQAFNGTEGAAFLDIPVGAGPSAMGGAYTALARDAYAPAYNPAGLPDATGPQVAAQHNSYLENINSDFVSAVVPFSSRHGVGVTGHYFGTGNIDRTDSNGVKSDSFSNYFAAAALSYGYRIVDNVTLGVTGKYIRGQLDSTSADAYAGDIGALVQITNMVSVGVAALNLGSSLKYVDQKDPLPRAYKIGVALRPLSALTVSVDGIARGAGTNGAAAGLEWRPVPLLALRAGYQTEPARETSAAAGVTAGVGIQMWGQELAYAYLPLDDLGNTNYFSLLLRFGDQRGSSAAPLSSYPLQQNQLTVAAPSAE